MEFLTVKKLLMSKKILQKFALLLMLFNILTEDLLYHRDKCFGSAFM